MVLIVFFFIVCVCVRVCWLLDTMPVTLFGGDSVINIFLPLKYTAVAPLCFHWVRGI